jgi:hypothetical protein
VAHHTGAPLLRAQVCAAIQLRTIATLAGHETRIRFPSIACIVRCITRPRARGLRSRATLHIHAPSAYTVGPIVRSLTPSFAHLTCGPRGRTTSVIVGVRRYGGCVSYRERGRGRVSAADAVASCLPFAGLRACTALEGMGLEIPPYPPYAVVGGFLCRSLCGGCSATAALVS